MRIKPLLLRDGDDLELAGRLRSRSISSGAAQRARIVLLASQGESNSSIAELVGVSRPTVISWRARYDVDGLPRSPGDRLRDLDAAAEEIRCHTLEFAPARETFGDRIGMPEKQTHDYIRNGTTTLFAALEIATGKVTGICRPRHRHQEFLVFLKHVARAYPKQELHLVMDNYATHKKAEVREWLAANPRIHVHFTPTSASWMNLVEVWFGIIERQAIHRGTFRSVRELTAKIREFINGWNPRAQPFVWTKTAEQILVKAD
eukprot:gene26200-31483_t